MIIVNKSDQGAPSIEVPFPWEAAMAGAGMIAATTPNVNPNVGLLSAQGTP